MTFVNQHLIPVDVAKTNPVRVTVLNHGLSSGDRVRATRFVSAPEPNPTGMQELNNLLFTVRVISADEFDLYRVNTFLFDRRVDGTNYTAFTGDGDPQFTLTGPDLNVQNIRQNP